MTVTVRRESARADVTSRGSPPTRARSADSTAISDPLPIATPRSARASAGASLIPSPTIATTCPARWISATTSALSAGSIPARTRSGAMPTASATTRAAASASPETSQISIPPRAGRARRRLPLDGSDRRSRRPRRADRRSRRRPSRRPGTARVDPGPIAIPCSSSRRRLPTTITRPSTIALTPRPGNASNPSIGRNPRLVAVGIRDQGVAERMLAGAFHGGGKIDDFAFVEARLRR